MTILAGIMIWIGVCFTLALGGALLTHKADLWVLAIIFILILFGSTFL